MKNHTYVLIFHTGICAGALQIPLMADANLRFASPCRENAPEWRVICAKIWFHFGRKHIKNMIPLHFPMNLM